MTFQQAIAICFKKYFSWDFTASKAEFWWFQLLGTGLPAVAFTFGTAIPAFTALASGASAFFFCPLLCVTARRLHDSGHNGLWALLGTVFPLSIIVGLLPEKLENNKFRGGLFCPKGHELETTSKWCMQCSDWLPGFSANV
jgi:uncharacterized membrane protein YhaH (DUF805 family)